MCHIGRRTGSNKTDIWGMPTFTPSTSVDVVSEKRGLVPTVMTAGTRMDMLGLAKMPLLEALCSSQFDPRRTVDLRERFFR